MMWAVEYELPSGTVGICLFSAENEAEAQSYLRAMRELDQHTHLFNLTQLPEGVTVEDLYRLFPAPAPRRSITNVKSNTH